MHRHTQEWNCLCTDNSHRIGLLHSEKPRAENMSASRKNSAASNFYEMPWNLNYVRHRFSQDALPFFACSEALRLGFFHSENKENLNSFVSLHKRLIC